MTAPLPPDPRPHAEEAEPGADPLHALRDAPSGAPQGKIVALSPRYERLVLEFSSTATRLGSGVNCVVLLGS